MGFRVSGLILYLVSVCVWLLELHSFALCVRDVQQIRRGTRCPHGGGLRIKGIGLRVKVYVIRLKVKGSG